MVSEKKIKDFLKRNISIFDALEEFETTGKIILKSRMNFTIDRNVSKKFRIYCKENKLNMSEIIEESMKSVIK